MNIKNVLTIVVVGLLIGSMAVVGFSRETPEAGPSDLEEGEWADLDKPTLGAPPEDTEGEAEKRERGAGGMGGSSGGDGGTGSGSAAAMTELVNLLDHYRRSYSKERERSVTITVRARMDRFEGAYLDLLGNDDHDYLKEAIQIAGHTGHKKLRRKLEILARSGPEALKGLAMIAADRIQPWKELELAEFMADVDTKVILAALECAAARKKHCPTGAMIRLFDHSDEEVRKAALESLPDQLTYRDRDELLAAIDHGSERSAQGAMRALAEMKIDKSIEDVLLARLDSPVRETRMLVVDILAEKGSKISKPERLWSRDSMGSLDDDEHAHVLRCLERTGSFNVNELKEAIDGMTKLPRYMAARCLVTAGDKDGIQHLLQILEDLEAQARDSEPEDPVLRATRILLGQISGKGQYTKADEFREWYESLGRFLPRDLPSPALELK